MLLFSATARNMVVCEGTLELFQPLRFALATTTQFKPALQTHLRGLALGKAPDAHKKSMAYRALYASAGRAAWTVHPMNPMVDDTITCHARALFLSAE